MDYIWIGIAVISLIIFLFMWYDSRNPAKAVSDTIEKMEEATKVIKDAHEAIEKIVKEYQEATKKLEDKEKK